MTLAAPGAVPQQGPSAGGQRIVIPAYSYPSPTALWDGGIAAADAVQFMIANPADGPGVIADSNYVAVLERVKASGIRVMGYVDTRYGERPVALVKADVDAWESLYGVTDAFLDQTASSPHELPYYLEIGDRIRMTPGAVVMFNSGNNVDEHYLHVADILNIFEGSRSAYAAFKPAEWTDAYPRSRFSHLIYDVPDEAGLDAVLRQSVAQRAGYVYVTSETLPHPWGALPPYWDAEVARIAQARAEAAADTSLFPLRKWLRRRS